MSFEYLLQLTIIAMAAIAAMALHLSDYNPNITNDCMSSPFGDDLCFFETMD